MDDGAFKKPFKKQVNVILLELYVVNYMYCAALDLVKLCLIIFWFINQCDKLSLKYQLL